MIARPAKPVSSAAVKNKWPWILLTLAALAFAWLLFGPTGGVKRSYINGLEHFNQMPNREFILQRDAYIFKDDRRDSAYPYIATAEEYPGLPATVSPAQHNTTHGSLRILDSVKIGTRFRLVSVRRDETKNSAEITYEILLENDAQRAYPRLDALFLLDPVHTDLTRPPLFLPRLVAERDKT